MKIYKIKPSLKNYATFQLVNFNKDYLQFEEIYKCQSLKNEWNIVEIFKIDKAKNLNTLIFLIFGEMELQLL